MGKTWCDTDGSVQTLLSENEEQNRTERDYAMPGHSPFFVQAEGYEVEIRYSDCKETLADRIDQYRQRQKRAK